MSQTFDEMVEELRKITGEAVPSNDSFDWDLLVSPLPTPKPKCECGSSKVGIPAYSAGHSTWCPVAEDEQTQPKKGMP